MGEAPIPVGEHIATLQVTYMEAKSGPSTAFGDHVNEAADIGTIYIENTFSVIADSPSILATGWICKSLTIYPS